MASSRKGQHFFTEEENAWLREHNDDGTHQYIANLFNERFGTKLSVQSITNHTIKRLHLHKKVNRGHISKGKRIAKSYPIGFEKWNGEYLYIKIADDICRKRASLAYNKNWIRKDYYVWKQHGNRLPKDKNEVLIHLNGDRKDCSIDNLYLTTRDANLFMSRNHWFTTSREHTLTAIKYCELMQALKGV